MNIAGQAAIVAGGASGLGSATATALAAAGAQVCIVDADGEAAERKAVQIGGIHQAVDVTDYAAIERALENAATSHGPARILINCAGICPIASVVDDQGAGLNFEQMWRTISVNLAGSIALLTAFAVRLASAPAIEEERGIAINVSSIAAFEGQRGQVAYAAAKAGVAAMTLPAARDLAQHRIRVMAIAPGMFRTPMIDMLSEDGKLGLGQQVPFPNRLGAPSEFARLVLDIVGNPMLNGEVIRLDGAHRLPA